MSCESGLVNESLRCATVPGLMFGEGMYDLCGWRLCAPSVPARARPLAFGVAGVVGREVRLIDSARWCVYVLAADPGREDTEPERPWSNRGIRLRAGVCGADC